MIARHDIRVAFFHAKGSGRVVIIPPKGLAPPGVVWRCVKAWYGTREASKCWGNEVTDTLIKEGCKAVVVPMMFVSENHGYVTVCRGDDFVSSGCAAALGEIDRVLTTHFDTKILPRIGPTAHGGEVTEGKHLWESNSKHVEDMVELCGLKQQSKGAPTPITKATGKGRRDIDNDLEPHDVQTFRQAAGTGLYLSIDRPSLQFAMSVVMSGMSEPKVVLQLQVVRVARYVLQHSGETWLFNFQADPKALYLHTDTDWAADELTRKSVSCTVERYGSHMLDCSVAKQSQVALSSGEAEFYGIVRTVATSKQTSQILEQIGMQLEVTIASDSIAALGICTRTGSGKVRHLSIKELWTQEAYRKEEFQLVSVDTMLNWADTGTKAHTSERLTSLLRQMPLRLTESQTKALACLTLMDTEGMEKVVMDEPRVLKWMLCDRACSIAASPSCQQNGFSRTFD